ncbi:MAG TPA: carboxypeptidase-like regulatory domain-containing protein, partial [Bryobacteraceae bacterium]
GQDIKDLQCSLAPFGVVAGVVREPDGEPVAGAAVVLVHMHFEEGVRKAESRQFAVTDDLGQYRMAKLPPGKYYLAALAPDRTDDDDPVAADHSPDAAHRIQSLQSAFYPGVRDPSETRPIDVPQGARLTGIDITLPRTPTASVIGRVAAPPGVQPGDVTLRTGSAGEFVAMFDHNLSPGRDGKFEFHGVPPGSYELSAGGKAGTRMYLARTHVVVAGDDIDAGRLELATRPEVAGRITVESGQAPAWNDMAIQFIGGPRGFSAGIPQGAFSAFVLPGRYDLILSHDGDDPQAVFVKSMRSGETDVFRDGLPVPDSGTVSVDIVLSRDVGGAGGVVLDADEKPVQGAAVVLVPEPGLRRRYDLFRQASSDQYGRFDFQRIPPGDYKVFAWEDVEPGLWHDPDFLKNVEKQGAPIAIRKDGRETVNLHLVK